LRTWLWHQKGWVIWWQVGWLWAWWWFFRYHRR
jgi:hypothetical protein